MTIVERFGTWSHGSAFAIAVGLTACNSAGVGPQSVAGMQPIGAVEMRETQPAYLHSDSTGNGTLFFNGKSYAFSVGGLGIDGMGLLMIDSPDDVYGLKAPDTFPGSYVEAPNLLFDGLSHPLSIGGLGVVDAQGEVYGLKTIDAFPGTYNEARDGFARGTASQGDLWLQNEKNVILHLKAEQEGLILSLGGSAMEISVTR